MYLLLDPPVSPFSPPEAIRDWIRELERLSARPEYAAAPARDQITAALAEAQAWLNTSLSVHASRDSRGGADKR